MNKSKTFSYNNVELDIRKKEGKCLLKVKMPDRYVGVSHPLNCDGGKHNNLYKRQLNAAREETLKIPL